MAGSFIKRGENKWELRVSNGYDENGKQRRYTKTIFAKTKREVSRELASFYLEVTGKIDLNKEVKFSEFVDYWKKRHGKNISVITMKRYEQLLKDRIIPAFGDIYLGKITDNDIIRFMENISESGVRLDNRNKPKLASATIQKHFKLLTLIFNKACEWKYLLRNPCKVVPKDMIIKVETKHYPIWNRGDLSRFLKILDTYPEDYTNIKNKLMFYLALGTGARRGEFLGLTWDKIDLDSCSINIVRSIKYINGKDPIFGKPKTSQSIRVLYFDDFIKKLLLKYKYELNLWLEKNNAINKMNLVFVSRSLTEAKETMPVDNKSFYLWLRRKCVKHDMPIITVHSLRAMAATYALMSGMPLNLVQAMMGHSNVSTTSIYLRDVADERKKITERYANSLNIMRK